MGTIADHSHSDEKPAGLGLLIVVLLLGFGLRLEFVSHVDLFVDEYTSMLAMEGVADHCLPVLPSGLIYGPKGVLHSYLGGAVIWAFGLSDFLISFISVLVSVMAICFVYRIGRDWFSPLVGLAAAAALASLPSCIEWGSRIRPYALLQTSSLIGAYLFVNAYVRNQNHRCGAMALLALSASVFAHPLGLITVGGLLIGMIVTRLTSPSHELWPPTLTAWHAAAGGLVIAAGILLNVAGSAWGVRDTLQETGQELLSFSSLLDVAIYALMFTRQFLAWPLWPFTVVYVLGLATLLFRTARGDTAPDDAIVLSLYLLTIDVWLLTSALSSGLYHHRYLFQILPFYFLLVAREWQRLLNRVLGTLDLRERWAGKLLPRVATVALVTALCLPSALESMSKTDNGWEPALGYVRDHWQEGDALATCSPTPSQFILGRADYYLTQKGETFNNADIWIGAPLVDTAEDFAAMLADHERVWFVVKREWCWEQNLSPRFQETIQNAMHLAHEHRGTLVFVSDPE